MRIYMNSHKAGWFQMCPSNLRMFTSSQLYRDSMGSYHLSCPYILPPQRSVRKAIMFGNWPNQFCKPKAHLKGKAWILEAIEAMNHGLNSNWGKITVSNALLSLTNTVCSYLWFFRLLEFFLSFTRLGVRITNARLKIMVMWSSAPWVVRILTC